METLSDVLTRLGEKIQGQAGQETVPAKPKAMSGTRSNLLPDRHPVRDFFIADILDWALKDDRHSMEHPIFSLSKNPDRRVRHYEHNGNSITVTPSIKGLANSVRGSEKAAARPLKLWPAARLKECGPLETIRYVAVYEGMGRGWKCYATL